MPLSRFSFILIFLFLVHPTASFSAPLTFVPIQLTQPDGTILNVFASGDEYYNWVHDKDNFTILPHPATGYYVYATIQQGKLIHTEYVVGKTDPAKIGLTAGVNVRPEVDRNAHLTKLFADDLSAHSAVAGSRYNIVIFIRFKNEPEFTDAQSVYAQMMNSETDPSMKNYYRETSNNQLEVTSTIYPQGSSIISYQDSEERNYYLKYDAHTNPTGYQSSQRSSRENALLRRALTFATPHIPANADLDGNSDGNIDNVVFIVYGSAAGWSDLLWPHMSAFGGTAYTVHNKKVSAYNFQLQKSIGWSVLNHEMGHSLGMPDLYRYNDNTITPVGSWDLMATNRVHMNGYAKWRYLKWIPNIPEITADGKYWLNKSSSSTNNIYKIRSPRSEKEFFVLEYRVKNGPYEGYLPGTGLIVYRVNERVNGNANGPPDGLYIYRPDGTLVKNGDLSAAHMGSNYGRTEISDATNPSSFLSDNYAGGLKITNIGIAGGDSISFDVEMVKEVTIKADYAAEATAFHWYDISQTGMVINSWMNGTASGDSTLDDGYSSAPIPLRFDFTFFGQTFNTIHVGINGLVSFTQKYLNVGSNGSPGSATTFGYFNGNVAWPGNSYFGNSIAIAYADYDLNTKDGYGGGNVMYQTLGDKFILTYLTIGTFEKKGDTSNTFQLVLDKTNSSITIHYRNFGMDDTRKSLKTGIQKDLTNGLSWVDAGDIAARIPVNNSAVKFVPSILSSYTADDMDIPTVCDLKQNYPNPFNPATVISYRISAFSHVRLKVYDVLGREVATLVDEFQQPGLYSSSFSALESSLSSGVYLYRLSAGHFSSTRKMVLTK